MFSLKSEIIILLLGFIYDWVLIFQKISAQYYIQTGEITECREYDFLEKSNEWQGLG